MTAYFDFAATAPLCPEAREALLFHTDIAFGNAGSRTHEFGVEANRAIQKARSQVAAVVGARPDEVVFTSGATEADNLAILGLRAYAEQSGRRHIIATAIEHKAVLEPLDFLSGQGFDVTLVPPGGDGRVDPQSVAGALRPDTLLVSVMHVNNETGAIQPIAEIGELLGAHEAYFHVDAAQGFGKDFAPLRNSRVQLISISGHKIYGPKGVGALVVRRGKAKIPLAPLFYGGGQERGLRPGTLPVPLIAAFGAAAAAAESQHEDRLSKCLEIRGRILDALSPLGAIVNGTSDQGLPSILNLSFPGLDSEAVMLVLKDLVAISNGSACTSASYEPSHVLTAMNLDQSQVDGALRFSWSHNSPEPEWSEVAARIRGLQ